MQVTLISRDGCSYCDMAKMALYHHQIPFTELKIGKQIDRDSVLLLTKEFNLNGTLPVIKIDDTYYNYDDFLKRINENADT